MPQMGLKPRNVKTNQITALHKIEYKLILAS